MDLAAPSKRLPSHRTDPRRSASHGIRSRGVPRRRPTCRRLLPGHVTAAVRPVCCQSTRTRSAPVVSHHLDGLLRTTGLGFVAPRSQTGFVTFHSAFSARAPAETDSQGLTPHSPQRGSHPSKNSPRRQPYHVTVAVALLPFLSCSRLPVRRSARSDQLPVPTTAAPRSLTRPEPGSVALAAPRFARRFLGRGPPCRARNVPAIAGDALTIADRPNLSSGLGLPFTAGRLRRAARASHIMSEHDA